MVMAALPAMIGMLPSPGGAVFSAPMVAEAAKGIAASPEQKHSSTTGTAISGSMSHTLSRASSWLPAERALNPTALSGSLPFALTVILAGAWFCFRGIDSSPSAADQRQNDRAAQFGTFLLMSAPILISLALVVFFKISAVLALSGGVAVLFAAHRYSPPQILKTLHESLSIRALLLVAGIMVFQEVLRATGALAGISGFFVTSQLPIPLLVALIPFIAGVMTGLTVGYVGITFPLLLPLMGSGQPNLWLEALAFASGFAGVMLSPVHLCLVLTREYFEADTTLVYHRLMVPSVVVLAAVLVPYLIYH
jgi:Uncharacterized conserved protein